MEILNLLMCHGPHLLYCRHTYRFFISIMQVNVPGVSLVYVSFISCLEYLGYIADVFDTKILAIRALVPQWCVTHGLVGPHLGPGDIV